MVLSDTLCKSESIYNREGIATVGNEHGTLCKDLFFFTVELLAPCFRNIILSSLSSVVPRGLNILD